MSASMDSFDTVRSFELDGKSYFYHAINEGALAQHASVDRLPVSVKVLLENLLRHEDGVSCSRADIEALAACKGMAKEQEISFRPARVLMQDFTGVPAVVDLAAMRAALVARGGDAQAINPLNPVDLVIDHSVTIDKYASASAFQENVDLEMQRNHERYEFLKWGQNAFKNFRVVPPGTGICHQVNLEYLAKTVWSQELAGKCWAYPDTLVGTDSHTTMINGLGVLGWGVGGIEAEAAMLGQAIPMLIPDVVGFELNGALNEGVTATDLVLRIVEMLRELGVVGKFVEFYGDGLDALPIADRATIANMAPEYGATCGFFPVDVRTLEYLRLSGRDETTVKLVEHYSKRQGMFRESGAAAPDFAATLHLDLGDVVSSVAGPKRPQDRVEIGKLKPSMTEFIELRGKAGELEKSFPVESIKASLRHGDVVIAAITSCTNTSNPAVMLGAGLLAQKAVAKGLKRKPWVKSSLAPGSKVVTDYLQAAGLDKALDQLGFNLVGYGCTTCIGNSGPLLPDIDKTIADNDLVACAVLSGNRNFEGRIHPRVKANWLASPPLVVAYALAGTTLIDLSRDPLGIDEDGEEVFLRDIWPSNQELAELAQLVKAEMFNKEYAAVFDGDVAWQAIASSQAPTYEFSADSSYIQLPPFFSSALAPEKANIENAAILALLGDSITTDHISPAGSIAPDSPAGKYLLSLGVSQDDFNSYGSRRGNHEVMLRGTFANIRLQNEMVPDVEGGYTRMAGTQEPLSIYDASMRYQQQGRELVVIAGKEYGTGSSRDWAAKGTLLLGVKAVIAESFERIHRSNLIGMGVLPLQFVDGQTRKSWQLSGDENIDVLDIDGELTAGSRVTIKVTFSDGTSQQHQVRLRLDTPIEIDYYRAGGVLQYVLNRLSDKTA